jgi:hypothetical protein
MYSPFYKFLINYHLLKNTPHPTTVHNTILGLMIHKKKHINIPLHEKYETLDFSPKPFKKNKAN